MTVMCQITAELVRALAVVKVTSQVSVNNQFSGSRHKPVVAINIKYGTIDYVCEGNPNPTFGGNWVTGGSPYR